MKNDLISVVIPVYNTEKYLERCVDSVINQSYKNLEIIIVNDSSTDNSMKIIDRYCNTDNRCKCINLEKNVGVGNARNIGINEANGKYLAFIDSDDWIDSNYYIELYSAIIETKANVAVSGIKTDYNNSISSTLRYEYKFQNLIDNKFALSLLTNRYSQDVFISPIVNNKLYLTSFLKETKLEFDPSKRAQDNFFSFMLFTYNGNIVLVPNTYYHYYQNDASATHTFGIKYIDDWADILASIKKELIHSEKYIDFKNEYLAFAERCFSSIFKMMFNSVYDVSLQKNYIKHIINRSKDFIEIETIIDYIDTDRIRRIFY